MRLYHIEQKVLSAQVPADTDPPMYVYAHVSKMSLRIATIAVPAGESGTCTFVGSAYGRSEKTVK